MATPTFVATKVGHGYLLLPKNPLATLDGASWFVGGAALLAAGAVRRGVGGAVMGLVGGGMLYRGATGRVPFDTLLFRPRCFGGPNGDPADSPTFQNDSLPTTQVPEDAVDEAAMQSFPASDPPALTPASSA